MEQLLLHLFGDFIVQNDHVALNKKNNTLKGWIYCAFHCITYALPFLLITNWKAVIGIGLTHFIFDKTNIVAYFLAWRNNARDKNTRIIHSISKYSHPLTISNFGFNEERPNYITVWLLIFTDNTFHLICNYIFINIFK